MDAKRIVVTGASGFVGSAVGELLIGLGHHVIGVSRRQPRAGSVSEFLRHDLVHPVPDRVQSPVDAVVHCAAMASPWAAPSSYQANNVQATRNVLDWSKRIRARRFIFISSSSVHYKAGVDQTGITEDTPLPAKPVNEYAATKRQAEKLVQGCGLEWVVLRPRAVFGPGDTVLFPRILHAARRGALPRMVRADGKSALTDLLFIENLSHYIERALFLDASSVARRTFNLTNNEPVELYPFLDALLDELRLPRPRRTVRIGTAMFLARGAELVSQYLLRYKEPPVTRFGVEMMAYSKTFDVSRMLKVFGPPPVTLAAGVDKFLEWQRREWQSV